MTSPLLAADHGWLSRTLQLAARGRYAASPNPLVGAVLVDRQGALLAEGWHRQVGGAHAEIDALSRLHAEQARGATVYVNLEPCSHHGRTPPCCDALIAAGVSRVVAIHADPDPRVRGAGLAKLRSAGVEVAVCATTPEADQAPWQLGLVERAVALNVAYLVAATQARPAVTLKWAMSLDGRIATPCGESQWISSPFGRRWALDLREQHDAILIGSGTALADDPRLDRRLGKAPGPILRVVLDRRLRVPPAAALFSIAGPVVLFTEPSSAPRRRAELAERGAEVVVLPQVAPAAVLAALFERGVRSVLVEGGPRVAGSFLAAGLFDRVAVCCAPVLIGGEGAPGAFAGAGPAKLAQAPRLDRLRVARRGPDLLLSGFRQECLPDLCSSVAAL